MRSSMFLLAEIITFFLSHLQSFCPGSLQPCTTAHNPTVFPFLWKVACPFDLALLLPPIHDMGWCSSSGRTSRTFGLVQKV